MKFLLTLSMLLVFFSASSQNVTLEDVKKQMEKDSIEQLSTQGAHVLNQFEVERFRFAMEQNRQVYGWQYISSILIFCLVMLIVITGLYLSYRQFILAEKMLMSKREIQTIEKGDSTVEIMQAGLELNKDGVKINTAVIGLVILVISLSFLYLYLSHVYPISIVQEHLPTVNP